MSFTSIKDKSLLRALEENTTLKDRPVKIHCVVARPLNFYSMKLHSISGNDLIVNFSLDKSKSNIFNNEIREFVEHLNNNNFKIDEALLGNIVTENKELPADAKIDLIVSLITLKYTQSNSVCFAYDGQAIGVGAGQQSRIHCTRLAGTKADTWFLRQHPKTLALKFRADLGRANRDNVIDGYINGNEEDVCADGIWQNYFTEQPERLTEGDKKAWLASRRNVALGSDAFFPFSDNIKRAFASGVKYIAEPGGSIRDDLVIEECNKKGMVMAFTGMRLFHH
jgi:phosphoribosylaminoimidazolecarboxamide formyltransferase/IMP cyclohydrolase